MSRLFPISEKRTPFPDFWDNVKVLVFNLFHHHILFHIHFLENIKVSLTKRMVFFPCVYSSFWFSFPVFSSPWGSLPRLYSHYRMDRQNQLSKIGNYIKFFFFSLPVKKGKLDGNNEGFFRFLVYQLADEFLNRKHPRAGPLALPKGLP